MTTGGSATRGVRRVAAIAVVAITSLALQATPLGDPNPFKAARGGSWPISALAAPGETVWRGEGTMHFRADAQLDPSQMGEGSSNKNEIYGRERSNG